MLIDTDVLIWVSRGNKKAIEILDEIDTTFISDVTYMELIQGALSKHEANSIDKTLREMDVKRLPIKQNISDIAVSLVRTYFHSHSMQLADALIAATALEHNLERISGNFKHFEVIENLVMHKFRV